MSSAGGSGYRFSPSPGRLPIASGWRSGKGPWCPARSRRAQPPRRASRSLNGAKVKDPRDLARQVAGMAPNTKVEIGFLRNGKQETAHVTITQLQEQTTHKRDTTPQTGGHAQTGRLGI